MKKIIMTLCVLFMACLCFAYIPDYAKDEIMTCDKIERGMKGYGLSVFCGVNIEKFNFTVLGVIKQFNRGKDVIYVELDHPRINRTNAGVLHGMSGSPCYIDGKLIGAVALGYTFHKENVCMLTCIEDMFDCWDPDIEKQGMGSGAVPQNNNNFAVPMQVSGLTPMTENLLKDSMREKGYILMAGGGKGDGHNMPDADKATLEPGAAVASVIIDGDILAASTGTVTYKHGNKILAYGHPFNEIGKTELPMAHAYIVDIFSSYEDSSKICNCLDIVGTVYQDRSFAIAGEIGREAKMCPVKVHVKDRTTGKEKNLNCRVPAAHTYFYDYSPIVILEGLNRCRVGQTPTTGKFTYKITLADDSQFEFSNIYTHQYSIAGQVREELAGLADKLMNSKYGLQDVKSLDVEGEVWDGNRFAFIERVFLDKNTYNPGDEMTIGIEMRKYASKDTYTEYRKIRIPETAEPGKFGLMIYGGILSDALKLVAKDDSISKVLGVEKDNTQSFNQYFGKYLETEKNSQLVISLVQEKSTTLVAKGEKLTDLPSYMKMLFSNTNNSVISAEPVEYKSVFDTDTIPMGLATITAPVDSQVKVSVLDISAKPLSSLFPLEGNKTVLLSDKDFMGTVIKFSQELDEAVKVTAKDVKDKKIESSFPADEGKEETKKTENKKEEEKKPAAKIRTSIKQPLSLEIKDAKDFDQGIYTNCAMGNGKILPTVEFAKTIPVNQQLVTAFAKTDSGYVIGSGLDCGIGFLKDGKVGEICPLDGLWVSSVCQAENIVYAAANPGSMVYRITGTEKPVCEKMMFDPHHKYISKMVSFGNSILMGFSDSDEILLLDKNLKVLKKANHGGVYTTDFVVYGEKVFIGTRDKILSADKSLDFRTEIVNPGGVATAVTVNSKGNIYAYITDKNIIIRKDERGIKKIAVKPGDMFAAYTDKTDTVFFAGRDKIVKIYKDDSFVTDTYTDVACQFSGIWDGGDGTAYLTSTNPGNIFRVNLHPKESVYTSPVMDFGEEITLKNIEVPMEGCSVLAGQSLDKAKAADKIGKVKDFRYFVKFSEESTGSFSKAVLKYYMPNRAPEVKITSLNTNDVIKGKSKIEFAVTDGDKDNYSVRITAKDSAGKVYDIYPNEKDKESPDKEPIKSFEYDTSNVPDGIYEITVSADDTVSNPTEGKTGSFTVTDITVRNQGPALVINQKDIKVKKGENIFISGKVSGKNILGVEYSAGGVFRSVPFAENAEFSLRIPAEKAGTVKITVRAVDEFENHTDCEVSAEVTE